MQSCFFKLCIAISNRNSIYSVGIVVSSKKNSKFCFKIILCGVVYCCISISRCGTTKCIRNI